MLTDLERRLEEHTQSLQEAERHDEHACDGRARRDGDAAAIFTR
jgi:transcription elongation GreA/GreB family factor